MSLDSHDVADGGVFCTVFCVLKLTAWTAGALTQHSLYHQMQNPPSLLQGHNGANIPETYQDIIEFLTHSNVPCKDPNCPRTRAREPHLHPSMEPVENEYTGCHRRFNKDRRLPPNYAEAPYHLEGRDPALPAIKIAANHPLWPFGRTFFYELEGTEEERDRINVWAHKENIPDGLDRDQLIRSKGLLELTDGLY